VRKRESIRRPWGNPFKVGSNGNREEVIRKYREHPAEQPELVARARRELNGKVLGCWRKPEACHGDALVELIEAAERDVTPRFME
jgi:Domain of unknown function (DUF4326)